MEVGIGRGSLYESRRSCRYGVQVPWLAWNPLGGLGRKQAAHGLCVLAVRAGPKVHLVQMAQCVSQGGGDKTPILTPSQNISAVPGNLPV